MSQSHSITGRLPSPRKKLRHIAACHQARQDLAYSNGPCERRQCVAPQGQPSRVNDQPLRARQHLSKSGCTALPAQIAQLYPSISLRPPSNLSLSPGSIASTPLRSPGPHLWQAWVLARLPSPRWRTSCGVAGRACPLAAGPWWRAGSIASRC